MSEVDDTSEYRGRKLAIQQALPMLDKIKISETRIHEWVKYWGGPDKVYVSFSGGKDSTVLLHLVRNLYPKC